MSRKPRCFASVTPYVVATIVFTVVVLLFLAHSPSAREADPDQKFHLALGRMTAEQGLLRKLPQASDIVWKDAFTNDYFLFTSLVAGAWMVGGEPAARALVPLLGICLLLLLFALCRPYLPWGWAIVLPLFLFLSYASASRYLCLRPSLLAVPLILALVLSLVHRKPVPAAILGFLFGLAYHAFYFPLFVLVLAGALGRLSGNGWWRPACAGALGLLAGILANPYFPGTLHITSAVFNRVLVPSLIPVELQSVENTPWGSEAFFGRMPFFALILFLSIWQLFRVSQLPEKRKPSLADDAPFLFFFFLAAAFDLALFLSFRAMEYAAPFSVVLTALYAHRFLKSRTQVHALMALGVALVLPDAVSIIRQPMEGIRDAKLETAGIERLPSEAAGKKVFNCDWSMGGPILYSRPDVRFVDLGDPLAIEAVHPGYASLKNQVWNVETPYLLGPIRYAFESDYVLCFGGSFTDALDASPHFRRLQPPPAEGPAKPQTVTIHEVAKQRHPAFVVQMEARRGDAWVPTENTAGVPLAMRSPYVNLKRAMQENMRKLASLECETLRPSAAEVARRVGSVRLGIGGGPAILVLWNGRRLFARQNWRPRLDLDKLVPLPRPLQVSDRIEVKVCRTEGEPMGAALSFWRNSDLDAVCSWKGLTGEGTRAALYGDRTPAICSLARAERVGN